MNDVHPSENSTSSPLQCPLWLVLGLLIGLMGYSLSLPVLDRTPELHSQVLKSLMIGIAFLVAGWVWATQRRERVRIVWQPRKAHLVQAVSHAIVYSYWASNNPMVAEQIWLILIQIPFAYAMDIGLAWKRYGTYRLGFAPLPIVGSTNLFLWMVDEWFLIQFVMIALAYLSREFILRRKSESVTHIFNPSAAGLVVVSLILLFLGETEWARGQYIASSLGNGAHCYDAILLAGLLVQFLFPVVWTTLSAFSTVLVFDLLYGASGGGSYFLDTTVPVAVFLGMVLLVTDPATSPRSRRGKCVFGALYGLSVIGLHSLLWEWGNVPWDPDITYFDKLLAVPLLNLLSPLIDRYAQALIPIFKPMNDRTLRGLGLGLWLLVYLIGRGGLVNHPGSSPAYWAELCESDAGACERFFAVWKIACDRSQPHTDCENTTRKALEIGCAAEADNACSRLAFHLVAQTEDADAVSEGLDRLVALCHVDHDAACVEAATVLSRSEPTPSQKRLHVLRTACHRKYGEACERLAILLSPNAQKEQERLRVSEYLFIASQDGRPIAQTMLAMWLLEGKVPNKDPSQSAHRVRSLLGKACRNRHEPYEKACKLLKTLEETKSQ